MNEIKERSGNKKFGISMEGPKGFNNIIFGDTLDELIDGLEEIEDGKFINTFIEKYPYLTEEQFKRIDLIMPQTNDAKEICKYACKRKVVSNVVDFEDVLIRKKKPWELLEFAKRVKGADIKKLENAIIQTKEYKAIIRFAIEVKGADIKKLEDIIIQSQNYIAILSFELGVEGANLLKIKNAYFEIKNIYAIIDFFKRHQEEQGIINQEDIERAEELIIESKSLRYICLFASEVKGANVKKLQKAIIEAEDVYYIYNFASKVPGADIEKLRAAIKKIGNKYYIRKFKDEFGPTPIGYYFSFLKTKKIKSN